LLILALLAAAGTQQPASEKKAEEEKPAASPTYVGTETCQGCHEDVVKAFEKNPHQSIESNEKRGWKGRSCESCHGPGSKHAESASATDIFNPAKAVAGKSDAACLKCHLNQATHVGRIQGGHGRSQVSCAACHSIHNHGPSGLVARKPAAVNKQCAACHTSVWAAFQKPHKHPLAQGAMSCVDCHNPHGSFLPKMLQTAGGNEMAWFRCHGAKRGPVIYEHVPVKLEGCSTCHEPHGSANPKMLTRHEVSVQCLECHANIAQPTGISPGGVGGGIPPAFHNLQSARYRNCTTCHIKVHGAHVRRTLLR